MFTVKDTNLCNQMNLMGQSIFLIEVTRLEERIATVKVSLLVWFTSVVLYYFLIIAFNRLAGIYSYTRFILAKTVGCLPEYSLYETENRRVAEFNHSS